MSVHALDALGSPVRREILHRLRARPLSVGDLADQFPVSRPAVSRHLRVLRDGGLVEVRREGRRNVYAVRLQGLASARDYLDGFWDAALARLEELAEERSPSPSVWRATWTPRSGCSRNASTTGGPRAAGMPASRRWWSWRPTASSSVSPAGTRCRRGGLCGGIPRTACCWSSSWRRIRTTRRRWPSRSIRRGAGRGSGWSTVPCRPARISGTSARRATRRCGVRSRGGSDGRGEGDGNA